MPLPFVVRSLLCALVLAGATRASAQPAVPTPIAPLGTGGRAALLAMGGDTMRPLPVADDAAWRRADSATVRLLPAKLPMLPAGVRADLTRRGCLIPQRYDARQPGNVLRGVFAGPRSRGWAVLCSVAGRSRVLVYLDGAARPDSLGEAADADFLELVGEGGIGFARTIAIAPRARVRDAAGGAVPARAVDHDGIADEGAGDATTVHFRTGGRWLALGRPDDDEGGD